MRKCQMLDLDIFWILMRLSYLLPRKTAVTVDIGFLFEIWLDDQNAIDIDGTNDKNE